MIWCQQILGKYFFLAKQISGVKNHFLSLSQKRQSQGCEQSGGDLQAEQKCSGYERRKGSDRYCNIAGRFSHVSVQSKEKQFSFFHLPFQINNLHIQMNVHQFKLNVIFCIYKSLGEDYGKEGVGIMYCSFTVGAVCL